MSEPSGRLRVTWTKSAIGYAENQKRTIAALGLRRLHQSVEHDNTAAIRGMVTTVAHLVHAEDATASKGRSRSGGPR